MAFPGGFQGLVGAGGPSSFPDPDDQSQYEKSASAREHIQAELEKQKEALQQRLAELDGLLDMAKQGHAAAENGAQKGYGDVQIPAGEIKRMRQDLPPFSLPGRPDLGLDGLGGGPGGGLGGGLRGRITPLIVRGPGLLQMSGGLSGAPQQGAIGEYMLSQKVIYDVMTRSGVRQSREAMGPMSIGMPHDMDRETLMRLKDVLGTSGIPTGGQLALPMPGGSGMGGNGMPGGAMPMPGGQFPGGPGGFSG